VRVTIGFLVVIAVVLLWAGAVCTPSYFHKDRDAGLTPLEAEMLKTEASKYCKIPAAWMQITEAVSRASPSGDIHNPPYPDGVVVWYGPFGIEYGRTEIQSGEGIRNRIDPGEGAWAWLFLFVPELALTGLAAFCFAPAIRRRWPKIRERVSGWERRHF